MFARIRTFLRSLRHRWRFERDLDDELEAHVALRADDLRHEGLTAAEAYRRARLELGSRERYKEEARAASGLAWLDQLAQDAGYTIRTLRRTPGFTAVALASVALGVGANTVIVSITNAVLVRPPAIAAPEEVRFLHSSNGPPLSFPNYRDLRDRNRTFTGLAAYRFSPMGLETGAGTTRVWGYLATGNYFDVLGIRPALGRLFTPEDDRVAGATRVAVLAYSTWRSRFAGDPAIIGRVIRVNGRPYTVLGVAEPGFNGVELLYRAELWVPITMQPEIEGWSWLENRQTYNSMVVGRLRPGTTVSRAEADLNAILAQLAHDFPAADAGLTVKLVKPGLLGDAGRRPMTAFARGVLLLSGLVLLAACLNLAGLLIARTSDRSREIALRQSIGAGRGRVTRQLITESVVLTLGGGLLGWIIAVLALGRMSRWQPALGIPLQLDVKPDYRVFFVALAATLAVGLWCGLASSRQARRVELNAALRGTPAGGGGRGWTTRDVVVAVQMALAFVLVSASVASIRGLARAFDLPLGFEPEGLVGVAMDLGLSSRTHEEGRTFQRRALQAAAGLPGVTSAAFANTLPLTADQSNLSVFSDRETTFEASHSITATYYTVSPGYFATAGTVIRSGRDFTWSDDYHSGPVVIVNETLAKRIFGTVDAVGRRIRFSRNAPPVDIVGVVEDGKYQTLTENQQPAFFRPAGQHYERIALVTVRTTRPADQMAGELRRAITAIDPTVPIYSAGGIAELAGFAFIPARAATLALTTFGLLALVLAVAGIHGTAAYAVSRRIREIGVRVALGAQPVQVLRFAFGRTALLLGVGSAVGFLLSLASARILATVVYQASGRDPVVQGLAMAVILAAGLGAAADPARRALSVDPVRAMRAD